MFPCPYATPPLRSTHSKAHRRLRLHVLHVLLALPSADPLRRHHHHLRVGSRSSAHGSLLCRVPNSSSSLPLLLTVLTILLLAVVLMLAVLLAVLLVLLLL